VLRYVASCHWEHKCLLFGCVYRQENDICLKEAEMDYIHLLLHSDNPVFDLTLTWLFKYK